LKSDLIRLEENMRDKWIRSAILIIFVGMSSAVLPARAQQDSDQPPSDNSQCTAQNLQGRYGYTASGWLVNPLRPVAGIGVLVFDGEGIILKAQDTINNNRAFSRHTTGVGNYTVNPNCTGSASIDLTSDPNSPPIDVEHLQFDFMIIPGTNGSEFSLIVTNSGTVETGDAQRIPNEGCPALNATVQGTYRLAAHGYVPGTGLSGPSASVGIRIVDGAGNLSGHDTVSNTGAIVPRDVLSTYTVNSDCTGTQQWIDGQTFDWVIVAGGTQVFFIRTDHPAIKIASGTYKKQSGSDEQD
jgi:hypothetical protein